MTDSLHYLTIRAAAERIADGSLSPVALVEASLSRIAHLEPTHHAFITLTAERALADARVAEKEIRSGHYRSPLHGIPIAHKDVFLTRGVRTTAHSTLLMDWVPDRDATVVSDLKRAGAISMGKTACHEFAYGTPSTEDPFPAARNPWSVDHMPGSSSSGSGAAVGSGMVFGATGTDTGGSVRHPAAACGIVGMKPTYGLISVDGVIPLAPTLDHAGPMTRNVADNALMLSAMKGYGKASDFAAQIGQPTQGLRLGVPRKFIETVSHTQEVLQAFEEALKVLQSLGVQISDIDPPNLEFAFDAANVIIAYEAYQYHAENFEQQPEKFAYPLRQRLGRGAVLPEEEYEQAITLMKELRATYASMFESTVDVMASPGREAAAETMADLMGNPVGKRGVTNRIYSLTGSPAITLPMRVGHGTLPLGIQFAANYYQEPLLYQLAAAYEQSAGWDRLHPN